MEVVKAATPAAGEFLEVCAVFVAVGGFCFSFHEVGNWGIDRLLEVFDRSSGDRTLQEVDRSSGDRTLQARISTLLLISLAAQKQYTSQN
jgi:hypothetical protein